MVVQEPVHDRAGGVMQAGLFSTEEAMFLD